MDDAVPARVPAREERQDVCGAIGWDGPTECEAPWVAAYIIFILRESIVMSGTFPLVFSAPVSGAPDLTATGSTQADALPLTRDVNVFTVVPAGSGAVLPSSYSPGAQITVLNRGSNNLLVYPPLGDQIEGNGINTPITVIWDSQTTFVSFDAPLTPSPRTWWLKDALASRQVIDGGSIDNTPIGSTTPNSLNGIVTATGSTNGRSLAARFADVVNVLDFIGCDPTGATDSTAAIQAAINRTQLLGTTLYVPAGTYLIAGTLSITAGMAIRGSDFYNTTLNFENGAADCITVVGASYTSQLYGFSIERLNLTCSGKTGGRMLLIAYASQAIVRDVYINACWTGIEAWVTNNLLIDYVQIQQVLGGASAPTVEGSYNPGRCFGLLWHAPGDGSARSDGLTTNNVVVQAQFSGAFGFLWDGAASTWNANNTTALECYKGLWVTNSAGGAANFPQFLEANNFNTDGATITGVQIDAGSNMQFTNAQIGNTSGESGQGNADTNALIINADIGGSYTNDIQFIGGKIGTCREAPALVLARDIQFIGTLFAAGSTTITGTYAGLEIGATAQDVIVVGCKTTSWSSPSGAFLNGVKIDAGATRIFVSGNSFFGCSGQEVNNLSSGDVFIGPYLDRSGVPSLAPSTNYASNNNTGDFRVTLQNTSVGAGVSASRELSTGTGNSYVLDALQDNNGAPYRLLSAGSAVTANYQDFPAHAWRNAAGSPLLSANATDVSATVPVVVPSYTVATLPSGMPAGARAIVTDATSPTFLGALTGGGAVKCPVFYNGSAWVAG